MPKRSKAVLDPPFTFLLDEEGRQKLDDLNLFCAINRIAMSKGRIIRTLLAHADANAELLELVRARHRKEVARETQLRRQGRQEKTRKPE